MGTALQLVAFNIPYPPDYGGVIDIFYKIKTLSECGVSIYLHCFEYNRAQATALEKYCVKVYYYTRMNGVWYQLSTKPYIATTRNNTQLLSNLASNSAPVLFEGIHTCLYLGNELLKDHLRIVRTHNVEHEYYLNLCKAEQNIFRKFFFRMEACKLKRYETVLKNASLLLSISPSDNLYFERKFGNSHFIPAFHPFNEITSKDGRGEYILFHGNLSVAENLQAVNYLVQHVFPMIKQNVIVAGKNPPESLRRKLQSCSNVRLVPNPESDQMEELIRNSHICLLPTFQDTGLKLKLLASLFSGRFCIANTPMVHKTGLEHLCYLANTPDEIIRAINQLFGREFTSEEIEKRKLILEDAFSNRLNAMKIIRLL